MLEPKYANWEFADRDHASPLMHVFSYMQAVNSRLPSILGVADDSWLVVQDGPEWHICVHMPAYLAACERALEKLENAEFFARTERENRKAMRELQDAAKACRDTDYSSSTNAELYSSFDAVFGAFVELNAWGNVVNAVDLIHNRLSDKFSALLTRKIKETNAPFSMAHAFATLMQPLDLPPLSLQDADFYRMLELYQNDSEIKQNETKAAIRKHARKYDWLSFHYDGPTVLDEAYFVDALASAKRQGVNPQEKLEELEEKTRALAVAQKQIENKLAFSPSEAHWVRVARSFGLLKLQRKDVVHQASCWTDGLLGEIGVRLGFSKREVRHLTPAELKDALVNGVALDKKEVKSRTEFSVLLPVDGTIVFFTGAKARELQKKVKYPAEHAAPAKGVARVMELKGFPASPGKARGTVRIIYHSDDMHKMKQGDILVSVATNPNLVPAMKKAAAIVTDMGGVTCHAAIVSRELGIPCVIATKVGTKTLKDGDLVEVDADAGVVKIIQNK